jgi:hypothetical protein
MNFSRLIFLAGILLIFGFTVIYSQVIEPTFYVGEKLTFKISWTNVVDAGTATMEVSEKLMFKGTEVYHIITKTKSAPVFSSFFYVDDRVDTYFDTDTFASYKYEKHLREGDFKVDDVYYFDPEDKIAVRDEKVISTLENAMDVLTGFYYTRTKDLKVGSSISFNHCDGKSNRIIKVKVLKKERITVPAGTFDCIQIEPILTDTEGIFNQTGRLWIWLTDDEKHMPVLMKSSIAIGDIEARLVKYDLGY